jgi:hypothetical protein
VAIPADAWPVVLDQALAHRLVGVMIEAADGGVLQLTEFQRAELMQQLRAAIVFRMLAERVALRVVGGLEQHGIEARVLKGLATGAAVHRDPMMRQVGDVDLLVRPEQFVEAARVVATLGGDESPYPLPGPVFMSTVKARTFAMDGLEVDLHQRIEALHKGSSLPPALGFDEPRTIALGDGKVSTPSLEVLFLHACLHLCAPSTRLSSMADLIRLARHPDLSLDGVIAAAGASRAGAYVAWALRRAQHFAPDEPALAAVLNACRPGPVRRLFVRELVQHRGWAYGLDALRGPRRLAATRELLLPSAEFRAQRRTREGG